MPPRGDHSITLPTVAASSEHGRIHLVRFRAHLDFVDNAHAVRFGQGSPSPDHYVTIDIGGFAPSTAASTGTPSLGGFTDYELLVHARSA